jgi:uncharacterized membrane protein
MEAPSLDDLMATFGPAGGLVITFLIICVIVLWKHNVAQQTRVQEIAENASAAKATLAERISALTESLWRMKS